VIHTTAVPRTIPFVLALLLCSCLCVAAPARAEGRSPARRGHGSPPPASSHPRGRGAPRSTSAAVREHLQSGNAYFQVGDYAHALQEFQKAYDLNHQPGLEYKIALCHERLGQPGQAAQQLRRFLGDERPQAIPNRAALELRVRDLERRAHQQELATLQSHPRPARSHRRPHVVASSGGIPLGALVSYIVGGAGVATFGVFGTLALIEDNQLATKCGPNCSEGEVSSLRRWSTLAEIGLGVGIVGAAIGTILLLTDHRGPASRTDHVSAHLSPWFPKGGAGVRSVVKF